MSTPVDNDKLKLPALELATFSEPIVADCVVVCAGFEDRACAFPSVLLAHPNSRAIVVEYHPKNVRNRIEEVTELLTHRSFRRDRIAIVRFPLSLPKSYTRDLALHLKGANSVAVDISGMSRLAILLTLEACRRADVDTTIFYSEAETYFPTEKQYIIARNSDAILRPSLEITRGLTGIYQPPEFSTVAMHGNPLSLILFMSFNENVSQAVVYQANPSRLFLVNGCPPDIRWREAATAWIHENLMREWSEDNPVRRDHGLPERTASTLDYRETASLLCDLYWELSPSSRISLCPTGSKMQTVASFLVAAMHKDIQVEYPVVRGYLDEYTVGCGKQWKLKLGRLGALVEQLRLRSLVANLEIAKPGFI
jgi:hypothetical protein